jgi:RNA-binding protein 8A
MFISLYVCNIGWRVSGVCGVCDFRSFLPEMSDVEMGEVRPEIGQKSKRKGRGFNNKRGAGPNTEQKDFSGYETIPSSTQGGKAQSSIEGFTLNIRHIQTHTGWIVLVAGIHEEATEDDVMDKYLEFGQIKNLHLNLDRRTGYVKGYALVEYANYKEAKNAIDATNNSELLGMKIQADFCFVRGGSSSVQEPQSKRR